MEQLAYYQLPNYWSRSALEQMRGRWHSLEWSPLILCLQSSAATSIDRCVQHRALRVMCVVLWSCGHLFSSVVAPLPYCGRSSRSHNKRNPKNRLIVNQRWLRALKDELLPPRPLCNKRQRGGFRWDQLIVERHMCSCAAQSGSGILC